MKSLFAIASLRQLRWPSVQTANVQRRQRHFWVIVSLLGSIHHVQNKGSVHKLVDGFSQCREAVDRSKYHMQFYLRQSKTPLFVCYNVEAAFRHVLLFSRRHRWCFTVLCWPRAHNYKNFICHQKSLNWLWLFFLYKSSVFPPAQTSLRCLSRGCRCLWGVVV